MKNKYEPWKLTLDELDTLQIILDSSVDDACEATNTTDCLPGNLRWLADLIDIKDKIDYQVENYGK